MRALLTFLLGFLLVISLFSIYFPGEFGEENEEKNAGKLNFEEEVNENSAEDDNHSFEDQFEFDDEGIFEWIGKSINDVIKEYGAPTRRDLSQYDYEWFVYKDNDYYIQIAVRGGKVVSVYTNDENANIGKIQIGDSYEKVNRQFQFEENLTLRQGVSSFQFELTAEELAMRPLVKYGNIWVQFYFDVMEDELSSIRYMDGETLLLQRPYSIIYRGELPELPMMTEEEWEEIQKGHALQIFDLTNMIRKRHGLLPLQWDEETAEVAFAHSLDMHDHNYFSHTSPNNGELLDRLQAKEILFQFAGENIAAKYVDGIAAVEGWLNSEGHRVNLLNEDFTHLGVGVYRDYYTQNFVTPW